MVDEGIQSDGISRAEEDSIAPSRRSTPKLQSRVTPRRCEAEAVQPESGPVQLGGSLAWKRPSPA